MFQTLHIFIPKWFLNVKYHN